MFVGLPPSLPALPRLITVGDTPRYYMHVSRNVRVRRGGKAIWVSFQVVNNGEDPHDATIRRASDGHVLKKSGLVQPISKTGHPTTLRIKLKPGRYILYCSLFTGGSHELRGMWTRFTVKKPLKRK